MALLRSISLSCQKIYPPCPRDRVDCRGSRANASPVTCVYLELGPKKVFACALDWAGWCRIGKSEERAIEALTDYAPRYRAIAERAGLHFDPGDIVVVERIPGNSTTDFGAPDAIPTADAVTAVRTAADRLATELGKVRVTPRFRTPLERELSASLAP